jgi:hypothetical protein
MLPVAAHGGRDHLLGLAGPCPYVVSGRRPVDHGVAQLSEPLHFDAHDISRLHRT